MIAWVGGFGDVRRPAHNQAKSLFAPRTECFVRGANNDDPAPLPRASGEFGLRQGHSPRVQLDDVVYRAQVADANQASETLPCNLLEGNSGYVAGRGWIVEVYRSNLFLYGCF